MELTKHFEYLSKCFKELPVAIQNKIKLNNLDDGNSRVSRLLLNWALMSNGYPLIIIKEQDRARYIQTLNEYGDTGNDQPFIDLVSE